MRAISLDVLDDVNEVFEVTGTADESIQVVEDDPVDDAACQVGKELSELWPHDDPVDDAVVLDHLLLLEG
jgi:hypothetical protein